MAQNQILKKILIRVPNWIGDAVMCLPAIESLRALYPGAGITVLAKPWTAPVFENNPCVANILYYNAGGEHKGVSSKLRLVSEIKQKRFDLALLFQNAFEAAFMAFLARIPERVGYARDLRTWLLTKPVPFSEEIKKAHHVFYYLNIVKELGGAFPVEPRPFIRLRKEELDWARGFLGGKGLSNGEPLIGCSPGASFGPAKRWAPGRFSGALETLTRELSASGSASTALIFGGGDDIEAASLVSEGLSERGIRHLNLAGKITLRQFMAIAALLKLFITNDSGPMHIAAALGVPTVAVFGSTDPSLTGPIGNQVRVVAKDLECSPCFERVCGNTEGVLYECLEAVKGEDVVGAARSLLGEVV
jgi:heptosyltransferase-2